MSPFPLPKTDRLGRPQKDPHRLFHGIGGALWLAERIPAREVPPEFWALDTSDADEPMAIVACPCSASPQVRLLGAITPCECERYFFFDGRTVWVWRDAGAVPDEPTPVAS